MTSTEQRISQGPQHNSNLVLIGVALVIGDAAYSSARHRIRRVLQALQISDVSCTLAAGDFSDFYRSLPIGARIDSIIISNQSCLTLSLETELSEHLCEQVIGCNRLHFQISSQSTSKEGYRRIVLSRSYPYVASADLTKAERILLEPTPEEALQAAIETEEALNQTQGRLTSVQDDLKIAADIQQRMLASQNQLKSIHPRVDCYAYMIPCLDIGGDFYDIINLDTDHIAVVAGDVSGKGVTASMMMATCITLLRAYCESFRSASRIMRKVNPRLIDGNEIDCLFTTLFFGIINLEKKTFTYCNAGHNPALILRADGSVEELADVHGPAIGVFSNIPYEETRVRFESGDKLLVYTDGVSEMFSPSGELYGAKRITDYLKSRPSSITANSLLDGLLADLKRFSEQELPHDDVTMVAIQTRGKDGEHVARRQHEAEATIEGISELMSMSDSFCNEHAIGADISGRLQLVLDELLVNVVRYGQAEHTPCPVIKLDLRYSFQTNLLIAELQDNGVQFNPFALAEPDTDLTIDERELGGLGIYLVRALAKTFSYSYEDPWNTILLEINCQSESES
mgnify:CR=1 FL=1